jgi:hypothetical protein
MSINSLNPTKFVLQGEYGTVQENGNIKTSVPTTCRVITAYDPVSKTGFLAHMDDYTSASDTIKKITTIFENKKPEIKLLGGGATQASRTNFKEISSILNFLDIPYETVPLKGYLKRPQIELDVGTGNLTFFEEENINDNIERLQKCEYAHFNKSLDRDFLGISGYNLPYFAVKEAKRSGAIWGLRSELQYERSPILDTKKTLLQLLQKGLAKECFSLEIKAACNQPNRLLSIAATDKELFPLLNFLLTFKAQLKITPRAINEALNQAIQSENEQAIKLLKAPETSQKEIVLNQLEELITTDLQMPIPLFAAFVDSDWDLLLERASEEPSYNPILKFFSLHHSLFPIDFTANDFPHLEAKSEIFKLSEEGLPLLRSLEEKNYALLFRQAAQKPAYLSLLFSLARNQKMLNFDIRAKGVTSGSALDIATKTNNTAAITFLSELFVSEPFFEDQAYIEQLSKLPILGASNFNETTEKVYTRIGENIFKVKGREVLERIYSYMNTRDPERAATINSYWHGIGNES